MPVRVTTDGERLNPWTPQALFEVEVGETSAPYPGDYAVSGDEQRFLVSSVVNELTRETLTCKPSGRRRSRSRRGALAAQTKKRSKASSTAEGASSAG